jgi:hypothetical protein
MAPLVLGGKALMNLLLVGGKSLEMKQHSPSSPSSSTSSSLLLLPWLGCGRKNSSLRRLLLRRPWHHHSEQEVAGPASFARNNKISALSIDASGDGDDEDGDAGIGPDKLLKEEVTGIALDAAVEGPSTQAVHEAARQAWESIGHSPAAAELVEAVADALADDAARVASSGIEPVADAGDDDDDLDKHKAEADADAEADAEADADADADADAEVEADAEADADADREDSTEALHLALDDVGSGHEEGSAASDAMTPPPSHPS